MENRWNDFWDRWDALGIWGQFGLSFTASIGLLLTLIEIAGK